MATPKYLMIKNDLKQQILAGKFEYGDLFYSESALEKMYDVSSITVIRAIKELVKDGYLVRYQGKGTFISRSRKDRPVKLSDLEVFTDSFDHDSVTVLSITKGDRQRIREHLGLSKDEFYYEIVRVRRVAEINFIIQYSYIPAEYIKFPEDKDHYKSVYKSLSQDFNIHLFDEPFSEIDEIVTPPNQEISRILNLSDREPVVKQTRTSILGSADNKIVEYIVSYKKWDFFKIQYESIDV